MIRLPRVAAVVLLGCAGWSCSDKPRTMAPTGALVSLSISGPTAGLVRGDVDQLRALAGFSDGSQLDVTTSTTWQSSDVRVAVVSGTGVITAVGPGSAEISAMHQGQTGKASASVVDAILTIKGLTSFIVGTSAQLTAALGKTDVSSQAVWQSLEPSIVTVSPSGVVTAVGPGEAPIHATYQGALGSRHLVVSQSCTFAGATGPQNYIWEATSSAKVLVPASVGCSWTAATDTSWIHLKSPLSGTGPGSVAFSLDEFEYSTATVPRLGHITARGSPAGTDLTVDVTQWPNCTGQVPPTVPLSFGPEGGKSKDLEVFLDHPSVCRWKVFSDANWIVITGSEPALHYGDRDVFINVSANPSPSPRTATVFHPYATYIVTQAGSPPTFQFLKPGQSVR